MPTFFLDTPDILPLPSLEAYTTVSVLLLSCSVYYAFQVTSEPDWKLNATLSLGVTLASDSLSNRSMDLEGLSGIMSQGNETSLHLGLLLENPLIVRFIDVLYLMLHEPLCIWTIINMAYCCLILVGKFIQKLVFGELRVSEQQHMKDRFWNFVFYKFIFIFGVMNVQFMDEVVLWCSWFSLLGFLCLLTQLCKDRFEYLSFSPMTPKWTHTRLLLLLVGILTASFSLFVVCVIVGLHSGFSTFAFMAAECSLVSVRTLYVIVRYAVHLWDLNYEGVWENRASYAYYSELIFELSILSIDFCHHLHMLFWGNIILSMASLVILMQLRFLFYEIKRRVRKHKNYLQVVQLMEANFPMATQEELDKNCDDCAICWDRMEVARKLPCGHLFHNSCLRSWLEQDTSCPTCRTSLKGRTDSEDGTGLRDGRARQNGGRAHFFHFDGSRYASWLPTVSVEVSRPHLLSIGLVTGEAPVPPSRTPLHNSQLESMIRQVQEWFPHLPVSVISEDLRQTRSVELTMENILDGRVTAPSIPSSREGSPTLPSSQQQPVASTSSAPDSLPEGATGSSIMEPMEEIDEEVDIRPSGPKVYGGRFSKSPDERVKMLNKRKEEMMKAARKMYLSKQKKEEISSASSSSASSSSAPSSSAPSSSSVTSFSPSLSSSSPKASCSSDLTNSDH